MLMDGLPAKGGVLQVKETGSSLDVGHALRGDGDAAIAFVLAHTDKLLDAFEALIGNSVDTMLPKQIRGLPPPSQPSLGKKERMNGTPETPMFHQFQFPIILNRTDKLAESPKRLDFRNPNSLSLWERVRERAVSRRLTFGTKRKPPHEV